MDVADLEVFGKLNYMATLGRQIDYGELVGVIGGGY